MIKYNDILNRMKTVYFEQSGENTDAVSDLSARFQAVASELYSLSCRAEYVLRQAFPQTAAGDYLDFHAALRDIMRKEAAYAYGELTFSLSEPALQDIEIPADTICSVKDMPYIQFGTTQAAVLASGKTAVTVPAKSTEPGSQYNVAAGSITVMVNPPEGVEAVTNNTVFDGGADTETDEMLRRRILDAYQIPQSGFSAQSLREAVMKNTDVLDANVTFDGTSICVYVIPKTAELSAALKAQIEDCMSISDVTEAEIDVSKATKEQAVLTVSAELACGNREEITAQLTEALQRTVNALRIGESLNLKKAASALMQTPGVTYCTVSAQNSVGDIIPCSPAGYIRAERITVNCYDA